MTNEEIRLKVADSLPWTPDIPNYPESLAACAEFEATLTDDELWQIDAILFNLPDCRAPFVATARQRCLAYLKTKGIIP